MDKKYEPYIHNGRPFSHEKGGHLATCNNMDALYDITYMWDLKSTTNSEHNKRKQTHKYRKQTSDYE